MYVYVIMPIIIVMLGFMESNQYSMIISKGVNEAYLPIKRRNLFYLLLIVLFLIVGGFRYKVGTDFGAYSSLYQVELYELINKFRTLDEPGIFLITFVCRYMWDEGLFVIFIENAIITLLVFKGIRSYGFKNITMTLLMYIFYCGWLFSFNGIRQAFAMAIIFAFSKKDEGKWIIRYIIVVFVAFLFHKSALFMAPILLIAHRKINIKQVVLIVFFASVIPTVGEVALNYMGLTMDSTDLYFTRDINPLRIAVAFAPLILLAFLYIKSQKVFFEENYFIINMVIMNAILTFMTANSAYMNRFARFTAMYIMIFMPKFADRLTAKSKILFNIVIISLYFILFLFEVKSSGNLLPFQWSFGHFGEY